MLFQHRPLKRVSQSSKSSPTYRDKDEFPPKRLRSSSYVPILGCSSRSAIGAPVHSAIVKRYLKATPNNVTDSELDSIWISISLVKPKSFAGIRMQAVLTAGGIVVKSMLFFNIISLFIPRSLHQDKSPFFVFSYHFLTEKSFTIPILVHCILS